MRGIWENKWFAVPVLIFLIGGTFLLYTIPYGNEILFFNAWRVEPFNTVFRLCTILGEVFVYIALGIAALL